MVTTLGSTSTATASGSCSGAAPSRGQLGSRRTTRSAPQHAGPRALRRESRDRPAPPRHPVERHAERRVHGDEDGGRRDPAGQDRRGGGPGSHQTLRSAHGVTPRGDGRRRAARAGVTCSSRSGVRAEGGREVAPRSRRDQGDRLGGRAHGLDQPADRVGRVGVRVGLAGRASSGGRRGRRAGPGRGRRTARRARRGPGRRRSRGGRGPAACCRSCARRCGCPTRSSRRAGPRSGCRAARAIATASSVPVSQSRMTGRATQSDAQTTVTGCLTTASKKYPLSFQAATSGGCARRRGGACEQLVGTVRGSGPLDVPLGPRLATTAAMDPRRAPGLPAVGADVDLGDRPDPAPGPPGQPEPLLPRDLGRPRQLEGRPHRVHAERRAVGRELAAGHPIPLGVPRRGQLGAGDLERAKPLGDAAHADPVFLGATRDSSSRVLVPSPNAATN